MDAKFRCCCGSMRSWVVVLTFNVDNEFRGRAGWVNVDGFAEGGRGGALKKYMGTESFAKFQTGRAVAGRDSMAS